MRLTLLAIALSFLTACATRHAPVVPSGSYVFVYSCTAGLGCAGEVVQVVGERDGWARLADGRMINLANVLALSPHEAPQPAAEVSPKLRVENQR